MLYNLCLRLAWMGSHVFFWYVCFALRCVPVLCEEKGQCCMSCWSRSYDLDTYMDVMLLKIFLPMTAGCLHLQQRQQTASHTQKSQSKSCRWYDLSDLFRCPALLWYNYILLSYEVSWWWSPMWTERIEDGNSCSQDLAGVMTSAFFQLNLTLREQSCW